MTNLLFDTVHSPIGEIGLVVQCNALVSVDFLDHSERMYDLLQKRFGSFQLKPDTHEFSDRLRAYFAGDFEAVYSVPVSVKGTAFQMNVWNTLKTIPRGTSISYGDLAAKIGQPRAAQAVGRANALNPILIFLPCHRIVGKDRSLVGYSAGLDRKQWLLNHEKVSQPLQDDTG